MDAGQRLNGEKALTAPVANTNVPTGENTKKKPGNQGDFHGQRLAFLDGKYASYTLASLQGPKWVQNWYNQVLFPEYWKKFHWSLPIDKEPSPNDVLPKDSELTPIQAEAKARTMNAMVTKIKTWFNQRRNAAKLNSSKNVWAPWLKQLREPGDPPRRRHDHQVYMSHPAFKDKVHAAFDEAWKNEVDQDKSRRMKVLCEVAKKLLRKEPVEVRAALDEEEEKRYQLARKKYDLGVSAETLSSAEDRADAIATLAAVVQPLLDGIRAHTGMYIGLTGVLPSNEASEIECIFLSAGKSTTGQDFAAQDPAGFRLFTKLFLRWGSVAAGVLPETALKGTPSNGIGSSSSPSTPTASPSKPSAPTASHRSSTQTSSATHLQTTGPPSTADKISKPSTDSDSNLKRAMEEVSRRLVDAGAKGVANEALLISVARMIPVERDERIKELSKMSEYEFRCANGISYKNAALARLGFKSPPPMPNNIANGDDDEPFDDAAYAPDDTDTIPPPSPSSRRTTRRNTALPISAATPAITDTTPSLPPPLQNTAKPTEGPVLVDGVNIEPVDKDAMDVDPPHGQPSTAVAQVSVSGPTKEVAVPFWFSAAFSAFESADQSVYGPQWFVAIKAWRELERHCRYLTNGKVLPTTSRPPQVGLWVKSARYHNVYQKVPNLDPRVFNKQWWSWWMAINPSWRERISGNRLSREASPSGSWNCVIVPGVNGLLSVLVSLWWWRARTPDSSPFFTSWKEAATDVAYALTAACAELASPDRVDTPAVSANKRRRTD